MSCSKRRSRHLIWGPRLEASRVDRNGISATKVDVIVNGQKDLPREEFWAITRRTTPRGTTMSMILMSTDTIMVREESHAHGRDLHEILRIIGAAPISDRAKQTASEIFVALGAAEAKSPQR